MNINYHSINNSTSFHSGRVPYISSRILDERAPFAMNAFSTRTGGVSTGIYDSLNLTFTRDDDPENVKKNFENIAGALSVDVNLIVSCRQIHSDNVLRVDKALLDRYEVEGKTNVLDREMDGYDAMITDIPGICLCTRHADCVPIYLVDSDKHVIGLAHSGWKGTVNNILQSCVDAMKDAYSARPEDLIAFIGPSICRDCYEVEYDVVKEFVDRYGEAVYEGIVSPVYGKEGKYLLDLHKAVFYNMIEAGIKPENIGITDICTCHNPEVLFSHRASKGRRGACCAFLMIK